MYTYQHTYEVYSTELPSHYLVSSKSDYTLLHHVILDPVSNNPSCSCDWYMHTGFKQHTCKHVEAAQAALVQQAKAV